MPKAYLEPDEIEKLEDSAKFIRDRLLIRLLFHAGCRVSEGIGIEVKDIDFTSGTVTIQHLKSRLTIGCPECGARLGRSHTFCPKCGVRMGQAIVREQQRRKMRTLPVDAGTLKILKDFVDQGGPVEKNGRLLLFPINRHRAWQVVSECAKRAGLPKLINPETGKIHGVSPHKLRDSFAVNALKTDDSGSGQRFLQEHLGHASFNTTARYRKVAGDELKQWYEKLWKNKGDGNGTSTD